MSNLAEKETRRSEEHTSELQSRLHLVCRLLLEKKPSIFDFPSQPSPGRPPVARSPPTSAFLSICRVQPKRSPGRTRVRRLTSILLFFFKCTGAPRFPPPSPTPLFPS